RSALREAADDAGDAEGRHAADPEDKRRRSARSDEPRRPPRTPSAAEDDGREAVDGRAPLPAVGRQARLHAGLRQELIAVPAPLDRHLRQQQAAAVALFDDEAVEADDKGGEIARIDLFHGTENRDL